jgi:hypothetical protein
VHKRRLNSAVFLAQFAVVELVAGVTGIDEIADEVGARADAGMN